MILMNSSPLLPPSRSSLCKKKHFSDYRGRVPTCSKSKSIIETGSAEASARCGSPTSLTVPDQREARKAMCCDLIPARGSGQRRQRQRACFMRMIFWYRESEGRPWTYLTWQWAWMEGTGQLCVPWGWVAVQLEERAERGGRGGRLQDACCWASVTVPAQVPPSFQNAAGREARGFSCTSSMLFLDNLIQPPLQSGS